MNSFETKVGKYISETVRISTLNRTIYWDYIRIILDNRKINGGWNRQKYDGNIKQGLSMILIDIY
jgi:hypothetical protein